MKNKWNNSVFLRLLFMFLLIMIPLFCIGIGIYNWGVGAVKDEINKSMIAQVSFYLNGLDTEIQRMKILQYECISDGDLNSLAFAEQSLNNYEKSQALLRLQQRMIAIKNSSPYIDDATVSIVGLNTTVSANNGVVKRIAEDEPDTMSAPYMARKSQLVLWQDQFYLNLTYPMSVDRSNAYVYLIQIKLLQGAFQDDLKQFNTYADSMSLLTTTRNGTFQLANGQSAGSTSGERALLAQHLNVEKTGVYDERINGKTYMAVYASSDYLGLSVARYVPESGVFSQINRYPLWLWTFALASLVILLLFSFSIYNFIHKPLRRLVQAFKNVEIGNMKVHIVHQHNDEFKYLYQRFNAMVGNLNTLIDQVYKQKILMQNAQLRQLQAQINPHFLYNTFFILYSIVQAEDYDTAKRFLQQLGSYFQYITRNTEDDVPLYREIEHARTYTNIQALRFSRRIAADFEELPPEFGTWMVPRLIIQPLIENAFKYGLEDKVAGGLLSIRFRGEDGCLLIDIEDNGNGMDEDALLALQKALANKDYEDEATGIVNIHKRLQLKFGDGSGLFAANREQGGFQVIMKLKLKGEQDV